MSVQPCWGLKLNSFSEIIHCFINYSRGDRIYKPKNVIREKVPKTLSTTANAFDFQVCFTTPHLQWLSQQPSAFDPTYCAVRAQRQQPRGCWPCPVKGMLKTYDCGNCLSPFHVLCHNRCCFSGSANIFPNLSFTFRNKIWHVKLIWKLTLNH